MTLQKLTREQRQAVEIANYYYSLAQYKKALQKQRHLAAKYWAKSYGRSEAILLG